jgi:hypothetical protein
LGYSSNISKCPPDQWKDVQEYGPVFMEQFKPYMDPASKNGAFLDACLIHGSTSTSIDGLTNAQAFQSWLSGANASTYGNFWVQKCTDGEVDPNGSILTGPCDRGPSCERFPA